MIYQVIGWLNSPAFIDYIHRRLVQLTYSKDKSLFDYIQNGIIKEAGDLTSYRFTEQFYEKQTFMALKNLIHAEHTMTCFRRVTMSRAHKYLNPEPGLTTDGMVMTDIKAMVSLIIKDED